RASLMDCHDSSQVLIANVRSTKKHVRVMVGDNYHVAYVTHKLKDVDIAFDIPVSYITLIEKIIGDTNFELQFDQNCIYAFSEILELSLPQTGVQAGTLEQFEGYLEKAKEWTASCAFEATDLQDAMKAMESIRDDDS